MSFVFLLGTLFILKMNFVEGWAVNRKQQLDPEYRKPNLPYITGDAFRNLADFIYDETNSILNSDAIPDKSIIFVGPYVLEHFFQYHHPRIPGKYILITHNTDDEAPGPYSQYLDEEKIIAWFAQNVEKVVHPKLFTIPIGLGNRYCYDVTLIDKMLKRSIAADTRDILVYMSFRPNTCPRERGRVIELFKNKPFCRYSVTNYNKYIDNLKDSKFAFSPRGHGLDCHRTWEILYMGAIPIVKSSASNEMFKDLPVLIVNDWDEVTEEFLIESYKGIRGKKHNLDKLFMDYWTNLIDDIKNYGIPAESLRLNK